MALSDAVIEEHIRSHTDRLAGTRFPYSAEWPSQIFRHEPLQNLALVLNSNQLLSRNAARGLQVLDVAAQEIVNNNNRAHDSARLYFRPRNPTQYWIEGIRKPLEIRYGAHAPMLGMMVFDARSILRAEGVRFSTCNMQHEDAIVGESDEFFIANMDFSRIYHNGSNGGDNTITAKRCAEVLMPSPMNIEGGLRAVFCRSEAEKDTLISLLNVDARRRWSGFIRVSDDLTYFEKKFAFVELVYLSEQGVIVQLARREDGRNIALSLECHHVASGNRIVLDLSPSAPSFIPRV